ncbi:MAG: SCO family protein [Alphaproteobacteria bacterium]|nr:SCO family protein [Alphaproteobacteria bacterium]
MLFGILAVVLVVGYGLYVWQGQWHEASARRYENASLSNPDENGGYQVGGHFAVVNQDGKTVTENDFGGKFLLITFGFTYCPDVCPTKLQEMALTLDALGEDAKWVQPVFISIDPLRDTPAQMKNYVALYHNNIQGLTGTPEQIAAVAKTFKVYYKRGEDVGDGNYMMDHSTQIYLTDKDGKALEVFGEGAGSDVMAQTIKGYLHK